MQAFGHDLAIAFNRHALAGQLHLGQQRRHGRANCEIVPKSLHAATPLAAGDKLEIVVAVGGG